MASFKVHRPPRQSIGTISSEFIYNGKRFQVTFEAMLNYTKNQYTETHYCVAQTPESETPFSNCL